MKKNSTINGATFKASSFFRPTVMSLAMADAGLIPAPHLVREMSKTALLRNKHDNSGTRPSVQVAF